MKGGRRHLFGFYALCAVVFLAALLWFLRNRSTRTAPGTSEGEPPAGPVVPEPPRIEVLPIAAELSSALSQADGSAESELEAVAQLLYFYRQAFGENPVGDNADIVAALSGSNGKNATWLAPGSPSVVDGELVDRWGTPYWFHAVGSREMEIRSAGPDREIFTTDDLTLP